MIFFFNLLEFKSTNDHSTGVLRIYFGYNRPDRGRIQFGANQFRVKRGEKIKQTGEYPSLYLVG